MQDRDSLSLTRINMYVITKKNTYEVNNEVYFAETFNEANKKIDKALKSGIITKNKAARQKSRIAKKLNNNN